MIYINYVEFEEKWGSDQAISFNIKDIASILVCFLPLNRCFHRQKQHFKQFTLAVLG
jgi:hypothetical protein